MSDDIVVLVMKSGFLGVGEAVGGIEGCFVGVIEGAMVGYLVGGTVGLFVGPIEG